MNKTSIEWVKNPDGSQGYTWNPITGCLNHINGMCKGGNFPCYAYGLAHGRLKSRYQDNSNLAPSQSGLKMHLASEFIDPFYPRFWPERLHEFLPRILGYRYHRFPMGIFVCDMSDLFGVGIPEEWTRRVLKACEVWPQHRFYLLTKQAQNLIKWSPFPDNCWVGVTVTKPEFFFPALDALDSIQCSIRYLSIEPMLAAFDVPDLSLLLEGSVDWLILGAQTKPYRPPTIQSVQEVVRAADQAGRPVFLKDNLKPILPDREPFYQKLGEGAGYIALSPLRQEMPG